MTAYALMPRNSMTPEPYPGNKRLSRMTGSAAHSQPPAPANGSV